MIEGRLKRMTVVHTSPVTYSLDLVHPENEQNLILNPFLGKKIKLEWTGQIYCQKCSKKTKRSFGEGFCYTCFSTAPEAAACIIHPELCRAHLGEGRDVAWELKHHNQPHIVYLAASDVVKVGVTRTTQIPTRWIDQGAWAAITLAQTSNRYEAGVLEVALKAFFTDKTNWQKMLKNETDPSIDLEQVKWEIADQLPQDLSQFISEDDGIHTIDYPALKYPTKITSVNFEKDPIVEGVLSAIKGQYLLFEDGKVMNIRKHTGFEVRVNY